MLHDPIRLSFGVRPHHAEPPPDGGPPLDGDQALPIPGQMTFDEFLQGLNPLHHVPVLGMVYRAATGTEIHPVMRIAGAAAVGGPAGIFFGVLGAIIEMSQPMERLAAARAGRPDPWLSPPPGAAPTAVADAPNPAEARTMAEAYRRWAQLG
jgi:hypothetical protein